MGSIIFRAGACLCGEDARPRVQPEIPCYTTHEVYQRCRRCGKVLRKSQLLTFARSLSQAKRPFQLWGILSAYALCAIANCTASAAPDFVPGAVETLTFSDSDVQSALATIMARHVELSRRRAALDKFRREKRSAPEPAEGRDPRADDADFDNFMAWLDSSSGANLSAADVANMENFKRSRRWVRSAADSPTASRPFVDVFYTPKNPYDSLGITDPPDDLIISQSASNVLFEKIGQTSPAVGFAHLKLDVDTIDLIEYIDQYQSAIRSVARIHDVCAVRGMFSNNSATDSFTCSPHKMQLAERSLHVALSDHFHSYVAFRAEAQALRDSFRPMATLYEDFLAEAGPNSKWMSDLKIALTREKELNPKVPRAAGLLTVLFASGISAAISHILWSFFTPGESANAAHVAVVAEHTVANGESLETTFSILAELASSLQALTEAVARRDRFVDLLANLNFARQAITRRISNTRAILDSAANGRLSSAAFTAFDLRKVSAQIHDRAAPLKMAPLSQSYVELLQSDCSLYRDEYGFSVVCHLPLLRLTDGGVHDKMDIYRLANLPIPLSHTLDLRIAPENKRLLALSPVTGEWRTMSASDLYDCKKQGTFFVCPLAGVLRAPLADSDTKLLSEDECIYHLFSGQFIGAAAACDAAVNQKAMGAVQTGPFSFAAFSPPEEPVLGEARCPLDPSFRRTILVDGVTSFEMPPSCKMTLGSYSLYSSDQTFVRESSGTSFEYPYPADVLGGEVSESDLKDISSSIEVAETLAGSTRVENWRKQRQTSQILKATGNSAWYNSLLIMGNHIILCLFAVFVFIILRRFHNRLRFLEGATAAPIPLTARLPCSPPPRPRRGDTARPPAAHIPLLAEDSAPIAPPPLYPTVPPSSPARTRSAIAIRAGEIASDIPRSASSPPPTYLSSMSVGQK